jgi:hypothetical protein
MNRMNRTNANVIQARALPLAATLLLGAAFLAPDAHAETVLMSQSTMVSGTFSSVHSFTTSQAGTLTLRLENIAWPEQLAALSCNLYGKDNLLGSLSTTGEIHLELAGPGTFFSHLFAQSGGALDVGLFSIKVSFDPAAPVPLPAGVWLLGSAFGWFGVRRLVGRAQSA